jgi:hypothetical protein
MLVEPYAKSLPQKLHGDHSGQTLRASGALPHGFSHYRFCHAVWGHQSLVFYVKKLPNGITDLKTVKSGDPNLNKQTVTSEKHVAAAIKRNR